MRSITLSLFACLGVVACAPVDDVSATDDAVSASGTWVTLGRGVRVITVRDPDGGTLRCADGQFRAECPVDGIQWSRAGRFSSDETVALQRAFTAGSVLLRGGYAGGSFAPTEVWLAMIPGATAGAGYWRVGVNNRACTPGPTTGCNPWRAAELGRSSDFMVGYVTWAGLNDAERALAEGAIRGDGVIVSGARGTVRVPDDRRTMQQLDAAQYYRRVRAGALLDVACRATARSCGVGFFCDNAAPNRCGDPVAPGLCHAAPLASQCRGTAQVCGCDGRTYASDCARRAAQVSLAATGACTTGADCIPALQATLTRAADGLLWTSESDYPLDFVRFTAAVPATGALTAADVARVLALPAGTTIELRDPARYEANLTNPENPDAARWAALFSTVRAQLTDVQLIAVGTIQVQVYLVGRPACGGLAGYHTVSIET